MTNTEKITHEIMDRHLAENDPYVHANILGEGFDTSTLPEADSSGMIRGLRFAAFFQVIIIAVVVIGWYIGKWKGWF